ncbi:MAG: DUF4270 family protein [Bacteroidetes bacterium]|nr:DUF4270 family protein [Bacteroidota bacterium]
MIRPLLIVLFISLTLLSCKKKEKDSILGLDVQPESDLLGLTITDTSTLFLHTIPGDSVKAYGDEYKYLGCNQDPVFGRSDASIYTNFSLPNNITGVSFGANVKLEHAELRLRLTGQVLGDTTTALHYDVYPLESVIPPDSTYFYAYGSYSFAHSNTPICSITTKLKQIDTTATHLGLVLPIDSVFASYILQNPQYLSDNATFLSHYKGLYIVASGNLNPSQQGAIVRFDLDDDASGLFMFYRNGGIPGLKPKQFQFTFKGTDARRFNHFSTSHSGATSNFYDQLTGDTAKGAYDLYLQGFGSTRLKCYLPFLKNYSDSQRVAINRAELILQVDETVNGSSADYARPGSIALLACNQNKQEAFVKDQYYTLVKFGGTYDSDNKRYVFNIARQMQDIVDGKVGNYGFYIVQADPTPQYVYKRDGRYERVVIGGTSNPVYKPKFIVTYTKFPYDK